MPPNPPKLPGPIGLMVAEIFYWTKFVKVRKPRSHFRNVALDIFKQGKKIENPNHIYKPGHIENLFDRGYKYLSQIQGRWIFEYEKQQQALSTQDTEIESLSSQSIIKPHLIHLGEWTYPKAPDGPYGPSTFVDPFNGKEFPVHLYLTTNEIPPPEQTLIDSTLFPEWKKHRNKYIYHRPTGKEGIYSTPRSRKRVAFFSYIQKEVRNVKVARRLSTRNEWKALLLEYPNAMANPSFRSWGKTLEYKPHLDLLSAPPFRKSNPSK